MLLMVFALSSEVTGVQAVMVSWVALLVAGILFVEVFVESPDLVVEGAEFVAEVLGGRDIRGFTGQFGEFLYDVEEFLGVAGVGEDSVLDEVPLRGSDELVVFCHGGLVGAACFRGFVVPPCFLESWAHAFGFLEVISEPGGVRGALSV